MTSVFNRSNFKIDKSGNSIAIFPKRANSVLIKILLKV